MREPVIMGGSVESYQNPFHENHLYLRIGEEELPSLDAGVFDALIREQGKPLQVMTSSDNTPLIQLLIRSGFVLKRRCWEMEVTEADLKEPLPEELPELFQAQRGMPAYQACGERMFVHYAETHTGVNPLTAPLEAFMEMLPDRVLYHRTPGGITAAAFVEENEIAYLYGEEEEEFLLFAWSLLKALFLHHDTILFEADDTDRAATCLKDLFVPQSGPGWDTYIKSVT